jgi:hypothetical protein
MIIKSARHRIKHTIGHEHEFSKEKYHIQKYLESLMSTLAFELFIVSGPSELKTNDPWWLEVARLDFFNLSLRATYCQGHYM